MEETQRAGEGKGAKERERKGERTAVSELCLSQKEVMIKIPSVTQLGKASKENSVTHLYDSTSPLLQPLLKTFSPRRNG